MHGNSRLFYDIRDGQMPVMDGLEATRILRSMGVVVPILAVTGNALMEDQDRFLKAGVNSVICKPVGKSRLQAAIAEYFPGLATL